MIRRQGRVYSAVGSNPTLTQKRFPLRKMCTWSEYWKFPTRGAILSRWGLQIPNLQAMTRQSFEVGAIRGRYNEQERKVEQRLVRWVIRVSYAIYHGTER